MIPKDYGLTYGHYFCCFFFFFLTQIKISQKKKDGFRGISVNTVSAVMQTQLNVLKGVVK